MIVEDMKIKGGDSMEIIEVEYGATISHNYNNYRVSLRAKIDTKKEDLGMVINELRKIVREELEKDIIESDSKIRDRINQVTAMLNSISDEIKEIRNSKEFKRIKEVASLKRDIEIIEKRKKEIEKRLVELMRR